MEFFPVFKEQMENEEFVALSPVKKLYFFLLQSKFNKSGEFYYSDASVAAALNSTIDTIRKYRVELTKKGWIKTTPGGRDKQGRGLATTYHYVKWANTPSKGEGLQFAKIRRTDFETLIMRTAKPSINSKQKANIIITFIALYYFKHFNSKNQDDFFITKTELNNLTGLNKPNDNVENLQKSITFNGENEQHLFNYKDKYHQFYFSDWLEVATPSEDEETMINQKKYWDNVHQIGLGMQDKLNKKVSKPKQKEQREIGTAFAERYIKMYKNEPQLLNEQIMKLVTISNEIGKNKLLHSINVYFEVDKIKGIHSTQRRTLGKFLEFRYWEIVS